MGDCRAGEIPERAVKGTVDDAASDQRPPEALEGLPRWCRGRDRDRDMRMLRSCWRRDVRLLMLGSCWRQQQRQRQQHMDSDHDGMRGLDLGPQIRLQAGKWRTNGNHPQNHCEATAKLMHRAVCFAFCFVVTRVQ